MKYFDILKNINKKFQFKWHFSLSKKIILVKF